MIQAIITQPRVSPGVAFGSPIGFGASGGDYFIGLNGATADNADAPGADNDFIGDIALDGSLTAGIGLGNPRTALGVELAVNVTSLRDDFGDSGSVALKIHRLIGPRGALSIGTENDIAWGDVKDVVDATTGTRFVSYSHYFQLRDDPVNPGGLMITVGIGDGRLGKRSDPEDPAPFASIGYAFTRQISAIVDYSGEATNIGLSVVPWRHLPISAVFGATDVGERRGDTEFAFGIGYSMPLLTVYAKEPR